VKKKSNKVNSTIRQWVDISVLDNIANKTDAHNMWTKLQCLYPRKTAQNEAFFIKRPINMKLRGDVLLLST